MTPFPPAAAPQSTPGVGPVGEPLKVLFVSSEVAPFAKTGGLADVAGALPKALRQLGVDVRVVMPLYAGMPWNDLEILDGSLSVPMWWGTAHGRVRVGKLPGSEVPVYCLEYHRYFDRPHLYGPPAEGYGDNLERFTYLSRGSLEVCKALGFIPDVIHCNDWQTALVPVYVNTVEWLQPLHGAATIYSIHNLAYQGVFDGGGLFITGLGREHYNAGEFEHFGAMNLTKAALKHSTLLSTVSPTYAQEIQTGAYGCGLDGILSERSGDLVGILNGIDVDEWNPAADRHITTAFDAADPRGKAACKAALQKEAGFAVRDDVPLFGIVGRLTPQKGFDVLAHALDRVLGWDVQIILLGTGDDDAQRFFSYVDAHRGDRFRAWLRFDNGRAHRIEAGADFFLMPSRFEPCGLNQMYSLRYGTLPIVRATGGLVDTVQNYEEASADGTGFVFNDLHPESLANTIGWAVSTWFDRPDHITIMKDRAMRQDFSWDRAAYAYRDLYLRARPTTRPVIARSARFAGRASPSPRAPPRPPQGLPAQRRCASACLDPFAALTPRLLSQSELRERVQRRGPALLGRPTLRRIRGGPAGGAKPLPRASGSERLTAPCARTSPGTAPPPPTATCTCARAPDDAASEKQTGRPEGRPVD